MARGIGLGQGLNAFAQGAAQGIGLVNMIDERKYRAEDRGLAMFDRQRRIAQEDEQLANQRADRQRDQQVGDLVEAFAILKGGGTLNEDQKQRMVSYGLNPRVHLDDQRLPQWADVAQEVLAGKRPGSDPQAIDLFNWRFLDNINRGAGEKVKTAFTATDGQQIPAGSEIVDKRVAGLRAAPSGESLLAVLKVTAKTPDGKSVTYLAPATEGRSTDASAGMLQIPVRQLIQAAQGDILLADAYRDPGFLSAIEAKIAGLKRELPSSRTDTRTYKQGDQEVTEFLDARGNVTKTVTAPRKLESENNATPYFTPLQTSEGVYRFNARSGQIEPLNGAGGLPLLSPAIDPSVQATVAGAKAEATAAGKARGEFAGEQEKKGAQAADTLQLLDEIEKLLPVATGSGAGAIRDRAGNFLGMSSEGSKAAAQLETLAPQLILKIPRMEGPQSDKDTQLYREAAGRLGDRVVPAPQRMAALRTLRELNQKYADRSATSEVPRVSSDGDYDALPSGAVFIDPEGKRRRKP